MNEVFHHNNTPCFLETQITCPIFTGTAEWRSGLRFGQKLLWRTERVTSTSERPIFPSTLNWLLKAAPSGTLSCLVCITSSNILLVSPIRKNFRPHTDWKNMAAMLWSLRNISIIMAKHDHDHVSWWQHDGHDSWQDYYMVFMVHAIIMQWSPSIFSRLLH